MSRGKSRRLAVLKTLLPFLSLLDDERELLGNYDGFVKGEEKYFIPPQKVLWLMTASALLGGAYTNRISALMFFYDFYNLL